MSAVGPGLTGAQPWSGSQPARLPARANDPVRALAHRQRPLLVRHLLRLSAEDRRLRFGVPASDATIELYIAKIDFSRDQTFGVFALERRLVGMAHLALDPARRFAEIGLSVEPAHRDRGYGHALLQRAIRHAASAGYRTLFMQCLAENEIIQHLSRKCGLEVLIADGEASAHIALSQQVHGVQSTSVLDRPPVLIDSLFKRHLVTFENVKAAGIYPIANPDGEAQ